MCTIGQIYACLLQAAQNATVKLIIRTHFKVSRPEFGAGSPHFA